MIAYHFCFDLTYHGWANWRMLDDAVWIACRTAIVTSFLLLAGVSLALRDDRERRVGRAEWFERSFVRRWAQVAAAAALVTAGSLALFPERFIYFGVLHFVAVALWLCRRAPRSIALSLGGGVAAIVAGVAFSNGAFDPIALNWIGFATRKPPTEDYVPLFPWIGVVLLGCGLGRAWIVRERRLWPPLRAAWSATPRPIGHGLAAMGRWSLTTYLVHQPLMLGTMALIRHAHL